MQCVHVFPAAPTLRSNWVTVWRVAIRASNYRRPGRNAEDSPTFIAPACGNAEPRWPACSLQHARRTIYAMWAAHQRAAPLLSQHTSHRSDSPPPFLAADRKPCGGRSSARCHLKATSEWPYKGAPKTLGSRPKAILRPRLSRPGEPTQRICKTVNHLSRHAITSSAACGRERAPHAGGVPAHRGVPAPPCRCSGGAAAQSKG